MISVLRLTLRAKATWLFEKQYDPTVSVEFTDGQRHSFEFKVEYFY